MRCERGPTAWHGCAVLSVLLLGSCEFLGSAGETIRDVGLKRLGDSGHERTAHDLRAVSAHVMPLLGQGETVARLEAIASAGDPDALARVRTHLVHEVAAVRHAATRCLRADRSPQAVAALCQRLEHDGEPQVRAAAGAILVRHSDTAALDAVSRHMSGEREASVRKAIVEAAAARVAADSSGRLSALLAGAARDDPTDEIRRLAEQGLAAAR